ncbi:uncharacterized protein LOC119083397 isoform X2 [Bradysia coprophila]|uniref:uncharacterized protein LOC119083397 isoform X2 n=1 Tax=Bradysia coprophila TaxID=38358 RepID=UPI00187DABD2|nr:uncharacterized protein LOC119083397 isoform X2 [Bradysia coprophila]
MYVIFPAEDLLYMTYGAALPRIKPRPTLDNLRDPLVPFGTRPSSPTSNVLTYSQDIYPISSTYANQSLPKEISTRPTSATQNVKTDAFGYPTSRLENNPREHTPSIHVEFANPGTTSYNHNPPINKEKDESSKPKHRFHLSLGRLGRSKQSQKAEPARLRDVTEIRIANPTFTRENLVQRNYDAFFESGEPVYSLERRAPFKPTPEPEPPPSSIIDHRPNSLKFFNKPKPSVTFRSKSAEVPVSVDVPQKGDRLTKKRRA